MNLVCSIRGHRRADAKTWDGEFYHSSCARCDAALVRLSGTPSWREPDETEKRYFARMKDEPDAAMIGGIGVPAEARAEHG